MTEIPQQPQSPMFDGEVSNAQARAKWKIPPGLDPRDAALADLDPGNDDWFEQHKELHVFQRLREEAPIHFVKNSQLGPYWSMTKFDDVKYVDTHQQLFSSDIMNGGIRLGGRPPDGANTGDVSSAYVHHARPTPAR